MTYEEIYKLLEKHGQTQLLKYYGELTEEEKRVLFSDIEKTDFSIVGNIKNKGVKKLGRLAPVGAVTKEEIKRRKRLFEEVGLGILREGKVGAVLLAGGQGTRLGYSGPKGTFDMGLTRSLSIFGLQFENIKSVAAKAGRHFPVFVMTSTVNNDETVKFFEENNFFGYPDDRVFFYIQDLSPVCGYDGKIFLSEKNRVALAPNGNGGWYSSLIGNGLGKIIDEENIEWLNIYSVDNVLQKICDPVFIGATVMKNCRCGAKVVKKVSAEEKVGVLCTEGGKPTVVEYYEMPEEFKSMEKDGELVFGYGVILNYLFGVRELNNTLGGKLPYHLAEKAVSHIENGVKFVAKEPCGYKFETLVVDMIKLTGSCLAYEVEREKEFAPVKNATGADSVDTARELLIKNGVTL